VHECVCVCMYVSVCMSVCCMCEWQFRMKELTGEDFTFRSSI